MDLKKNNRPIILKIIIGWVTSVNNSHFLIQFVS